MANKQASTMLKVAMKFVGYKEKLTNKDLDNFNANAGPNNWNKFAAYIDKYCPEFYNGKKNGYGWCDIFVDYCFIVAFGEDAARDLLCAPKKSCGAGPEFSYKYFAAKNQTGKDPKKGANIFFGTSAKNVPHIGIVYDFDDTYVYTVEGNTSQQVALRKYTRNNANIFCYGYPKFDDEPESNFAEVSKYIGTGDGENWEYPIRPMNSPESKPTPEPTPTPSEPKYNAKVTASELNLRKGPGTNYPVLAVITKNTVVPVYDDSTNKGWSYIKYGEIYGYVSSNYLTKVNTPVPTPTPTPSPAPATKTTGVVTTKSSPLNVRKGPGTNYAVLFTVPKGATVTINSETKDSKGALWYNIVYNGKAGYASAQYITKTSTPQPTGDDDTVLFNGVVATNGSVLNVRKGPGTSYAIIATLKNGTKVNICGNENNWYKLKLNSNSYGYASASYIRKI